MACVVSPLDTLDWVADALQSERREIERRHAEMLSGLREGLEKSLLEAEVGDAGEGADASGQERPTTPYSQKSMPISEVSQAMDKQADEEKEIEIDALHGIARLNSRSLFTQDFDSLAAGESAASFEKRKRKKRKLRTEEDDLSQNDLGHWGDRLRAMVGSVYFEATFALLIVLNTFVMAVEAEYNGFEGCHQLEMEGCEQGKEVVWPGAGQAFTNLENVFGILFTVEVLAKVYGQRLHFLMSWWNWFDSLIIGCWLVGLFGEFNLFINPMILRLVRMFRLLRLVRLVKTFQVFETLHLMVAALKASGTVLLWMSVFLFVIMLACTLAITFSLEKYYKDPTIPEETREEVFLYFGSFTRGFLSMFEVTLGNWVPITRLLHEDVSTMFLPLMLLYRTLVGEALIKVVTGVFMFETFRCAQADDEMMIMDKSRQMKRHIDKMRMLLDEADDSGDGYLDFQEFKNATNDPRIKAWLAAMDIQVQHAGDMFRLVESDGDKRISPEELVQGFARLKGPARAYDMAVLLSKLDLDMKNIQSRLGQLDKLDKLDKLDRLDCSYEGSVEI